MPFRHPGCADMLRRRLLYLTVLGSCLVFYAAYQEWFSWFVLVLAAVVPWLSLLLSLPAMVTFRAEVSAPAQVEQGTAVSLQLYGGCRLPVPPFRGRLHMTHIPTGETVGEKRSFALPTDHCGGITVRAEKVRVCDYLGLFTLPVRRCPSRTVTVRPRPLPIRDLPPLDRYLARAWRPKAGGGFAENHELRLYRPGDSLNQVHWKLTAKTGKLILREPMEPEKGLVLVTMTLNGSAGELDRKFGRLLWLGHYLLGKRVRFELRVLTGDGVSTYLVSGEPGLWEALNALLSAPPAREGSLGAFREQPAWHCHIGGAADES